MKIDLAQGTVEWFEAYIASEATKPFGYRHLGGAPHSHTAQVQYSKSQLGIYTDEVRLGYNDVVFYVSDLNAETLQLISSLVIIMPTGEAVFDFLDTDEYWEPYSDHASHRLEITYRVPPVEKAK